MLHTVNGFNFLLCRRNENQLMSKPKTIQSLSDLLLCIKNHEEMYKKEIGSYYSKKGERSLSGPPWYKYKANLWFRGHAKSIWELKPKVERDDFCKAAKEALSTPEDYEQSIFNQFITQGAHLLPSNLDRTEKYFLSQHYGLPTRLLDWSTNPLTAFFFAVIDEPKIDGAIYVFFARGEFVGHEESDVVYQNDPKVTSQVESLFNRKNSYEGRQAMYPLRIIPYSQAGRMLQQGSRFTYHFPFGIPLEKQLNKNIFKYIVPLDCKNEILKDLQMLGAHWANLFPDLEHLVKELKRQAHIK